jgi:Ca2+-transporting ATPase
VRALVAVALCGLVLALGLLRGQPLELMVVTAISLAVAAVPESLPAVVTLSLALGAKRMAVRHAVVRRLSAVETLGSVTVLATDKTGTLTRAVMVVEELWTPERVVRVSGEGYDPHGTFPSSGEVLRVGCAPDVRELLLAAVLCNDARLVAPQEPGQQWRGLGDPTEVALLVAAAKEGMDKAVVEEHHPRLTELPFDSRRQQMTTVHERDEDGGSVVAFTKGSVESLRAQHRNRDDRPLWQEASQHADRLASRGLRVLAFTTAEPARGADWRRADQRLLGLVAMDDPAKPAARSTIERCARAGICTVLITGDHAATARAIATEVGMLSLGDDARVVTGPEIVAGEVADLTAATVFARTTPEQKLAIVQAQQDRGAVVAMTGDGVNDAPALRRSDIGVAMGHRGTEVARQAADRGRADDDLETVVAAVEEGRRVYANIRLFLLFGLAGGAAEIATMLLGPLAGLAVPLLAAQILWINLLTHGLTGVAIGAEPVDPRAMEQPPRPPDQSILGAGLWQRVLLTAAVLTTTTLGLAVWAHDAGRAWQTMLFVGLTTAQLGVALGLRQRQLSVANPLLPVAVVGSLMLALAGVYVPLLQTLLGTVPLSGPDLAVALTPGIAGWCIALLVRRGRGPTTSRPWSLHREPGGRKHGWDKEGVAP